MLAIGVHIILVSGGGIDVIATAIAALAMYASVKAVTMLGLGDHVAYVFAIAMMIGLVLGLINGFFVDTLQLPSLIVTLGTLSVYRGLLLTFVGTTVISNLPLGMRALATSSIPRSSDLRTGRSIPCPPRFWSWPPWSSAPGFC